MNVAIIGSGASGLTAIKCCLDEGLKPVCFEREHDIGGLWRYEPGQKDGATVYKSTVINSSKEMMCYSDFPIPDDFPNFVHNSKVLDYYRLYQERFGLRKHIRFFTEVISCKPADGFKDHGKWQVTSRDIKTQQEKTECFNAILVCIGHHAIPYYPWKEFSGIENFKGKHMHSHDYRDFRGFEDKRVLVIGFGNSGGDISVELSRHSKKVFQSIRRGAWILNRIFKRGMPTDIVSFKRINEFVQKVLPSWVIDQATQKLLNERFDHAKYGLKPNLPVFSQHPSINDDLPNRIITGTLIIKPNVKHFTGTGVVFTDGSEEEVDIVIFATGYSFYFPFIDDSIFKVVENEVELYKYVFPLNLAKPTLAVIGCVQPLGAVNPISEMQCRWATRVFNGKALLPSVDKMKEDLIAKKTAMQKHYVKSRRHTIQINYVPYMDELAEMISCKPNIVKFLLTDPRLGLQLIFGPAVPYQFRLQGPGKLPEARSHVMTVMDRVLYPLNTRSVENNAVERNPFSSFLFVFIVAVFFAWIFRLF